MVVLRRGDSIRDERALQELQYSTVLLAAGGCLARLLSRSLRMLQSVVTVPLLPTCTTDHRVFSMRLNKNDIVTNAEKREIILDDLQRTIMSNGT